MSKVVLKIENLSKQYRLGEVGSGTISHDLNRFWARIRGKEDPLSQIGQVNDRASEAVSDYVWALKDINFELREGEILGVIGKNGAGKSTLLKLISKITSPTSGSIKAKGRIASLLEVGTGMHPEMTARENIYLNGAILGMTKSEIKKKFDEIIDFAGVGLYVDTPVKRFSSGMRVRLGFAVAAFLEPEILIVDEVLAVGDVEFQKKAIGKMKDVSSNSGRTVLFVSHNMSSIKTLCDSGLVMSNGMVAYKGDIDASIQYYLGNSQNLNCYKNFENLDARPGSKDVDLLEYKLIDKYGEIVDSFNLYEEVSVQMKYHIKSLNGKFYPNIHVLDKYENYFLVDTIPENEIPNETGIYISTFKFPKYIFNTGEYSIGLAVTSFPGSIVHFFENPALVFNVTEDDLSLRIGPSTGVLPGVTRIQLQTETIKG